MQWLMENWLLVALFGGMAAMHLVGHRRGSSGGGCCGGKRPARVISRDKTASPGTDSSDRPEDP